MTRPFLRNLLVILICCATTFVTAQSELVKDINTGQKEFENASFCQCGDMLFFTAANEKGNELWVSDGTENGTRLVKDINNGYSNGGGEPLVCNGQGRIFFRADDGVHGFELWSSDGTESGTSLVLDIIPGRQGDIHSLAELNNLIYFFTDHDLDRRMELWVTDGTIDNTAIVKVMDPEINNLYQVIATSKNIYYNFLNSISGKFELWTTDGTTANTIKLREGGWLSGYTVAGEFVFMGFSEDSNSLWITDGTTAGTTLIKDMGYSWFGQFHSFHNKIVFTLGNDTWISDGTETGTHLLATGQVDGGAVIGTNFFGMGRHASAGVQQLLKTDGVNVETELIPTMTSYYNVYGKLPVTGEKLVVPYANDEIGIELGITGSSLNVSLLKDINPGSASSSPKNWTEFEGKIYFLADDGINGRELWRTDGTEAGTYLVKDIVTSTLDAFSPLLPQNVYVNDGKMVLITKTIVSPLADLFESDGTESGTKLKYDFPGNLVFLGKTDADLIYLAHADVYKYNLASQEVSFVKSLDDFSGFNIMFKLFYTLGNKLVFAFGPNTLGSEFWVTDGTENGTTILKDIYPGSMRGISGDGIVFDSHLFFDGNNSVDGNELWVTDGTSEQTQLLKDINPGAASSDPGLFVHLGDKIVFVATTESNGRELWISDGTGENTNLLFDLVPGIGSSDPTNLTSIGNLVLFTMYDDVKGWTLWKTDGTTEGTMMIKDFEAGNKKSNSPAYLKAIGGKVYFSCMDDAHGNELWVSDGTSSGTYVIDIIPGKEGSNPSRFTDIRGIAYFRANAQLWRTDGSQFGTTKVDDREPSEIHIMNDWVYFIAADVNYGLELFKLPFTKVDQEITLVTPESKVVGDTPFLLTAAASSGLPVGLVINDVIQIEEDVATIVKPGTVTITATQPGNTIYNPAEIIHSFCINPAKPAITLEGSPSEPKLISSSALGNQWFVNNEKITGAITNNHFPEEDGTFQVSVTIDGCTSELSDEETIVITATEGYENFLNFYPNPVMDILKIEARENVQKIQVEIIDTKGRSAGSHNLRGDEVLHLSFANYPAGLYIVKITSQNSVYTKKVLKE